MWTNKRVRERTSRGYGGMRYGIRVVKVGEPAEWRRDGGEMERAKRS